MTTEGNKDKIDIKKVRRRTEDVLRKSDDATILSVAKFLRVKTGTTNLNKGKGEEYNAH